MSERDYDGENVEVMDLCQEMADCLGVMVLEFMPDFSASFDFDLPLIWRHPFAFFDPCLSCRYIV